MLLDRSPGRSTARLEWRIRLFGVGAILGLAGIWADAGWMVTLAILVLLVGVGLRFLPDPEEDEDRT